MRVRRHSAATDVFEQRVRERVTHCVDVYVCAIFVYVLFCIVLYLINNYR